MKAPRIEARRRGLVLKDVMALMARLMRLMKPTLV